MLTLRTVQMVKGEGAKYLVTEGDLTLGGGHTMQCTDHGSQKCTRETCGTLLTNVTPINFIKKERHKQMKVKYCYFQHGYILRLVC